jgi:GR25 family glycosyltransferase involved in LPS biosynthesis
MHSIGGFIFATKSKKLNGKIKAVQFLLNGNYPKQEQSVQNLLTLEQYGIDYKRHYNDVYKDPPPASKSSRPHDVSMELKPNSLTPAHYGCYDSFRTAVLSEFDSDLDYFLIFEGDAKIQDHTVFMSKLNEAIRLIDKYNLDYVSFGGIYDLEFGVLQSRVVEEMTEDFFVCDKIIGCQCLLFPQKSRKKIKEILRTEPWDALDIYLNNVSAKHRLRVGVSQKTLVTQYDGVSTIDSVVKQFKEFSI